MKMVFQKFENDLSLERGCVNVVRIEDKALFSRCVESLNLAFSAESPEPAMVFESGAPLKPKDCIFMVGDLLAFDLADRKIVNLALRRIVEDLSKYEGVVANLELLNNSIVGLLEDQMNQMAGDYVIEGDWDAAAFLKAAGFSIDSVVEDGLFGKACRFLRIAADLFPDKVLAFVNLNTYLDKAQYCEFGRMAKANELIILSYEVGDSPDFEYFENGMFIDANYCEISSLLG